MSSSMFLKRKLSRDEDDEDRRDYAPTKVSAPATLGSHWPMRFATQVDIRILTDVSDALSLLQHVKLATPSADSNDMAMSDAGMNVVPFPTFATPFPGYAQLAINTSSTSDRSPNNSISSLPSASPLSAYPAFDLYPEVETPMDVDMESAPSTHHHSSSISSINSNTSSSPTMATGLLQPVMSLQHGGNCTSIPRLRMSSHRGLHGTRTLWSHCESCGAIEMVSA